MPVDRSPAPGAPGLPQTAVKNNTHTTENAHQSPLSAVFGMPFLAQIAAEGTEAVGTLEPSTGLPGVDMTRYALVCVGLVAAILALAWGFRRALAGNLRGRAGRRSMRVVDVLPLGGKRQLAVVRCYDRTFVLGLGERDVSLVTELDADEDVEGNLQVIGKRQQGTQQAEPSKNIEEEVAPTQTAPAPPKAGLFSSILASARNGLAHNSPKVQGSGEARVVSAAQAKADAPAAVTEFTSPEPAPASTSNKEAKAAAQQPKAGGWIG